MERHKFNTRYQPDETTEQYITDLKKLATTCEYGNLKDDLIRDRLVCGVNNESIRRQMLKEATDWVSSMVAAKKKSGEIRVCLDP